MADDPLDLPPPETRPASLEDVIDRLMIVEGKVERLHPSAAPEPPVVEPPPPEQISTPFPKVASSGEWTLLASDRYGWITGEMIREKSQEPGLNGKSWQRFSIDNSPDGIRSVHQHIDKRDEVNPIRFDTQLFPTRADTRYILLRYQTYQIGWQGVGGKFMAIMGGRGMAGGSYCYDASEKYGNGGWSHVLMHPEYRGQNALRGYCYSANRDDFGAEKGFGDTYGRGDKPFPQKRWYTSDVLTQVPTGIAEILMDGVTVAKQDGVDWAGKGKVAKGVWIRWRFMYGGNPDQLLAPNVVDQWIKNIEIWSHP